MKKPSPHTTRPFLYEPSQLEREAIRALQVVRDTVPLQQESVDRIYAGTIARARYDAFVTRHNVRPRRSAHVCLYRLLGAKRCPDQWDNPCDSPHLLPSCDHMSEWMRGGKTVALVSQPYDWPWSSMCATVDLGRQMGFEVQVSARDSWHFPGWTTLILYTRK